MPIKALPAYSVVGVVFAYFAFRYEAFDFLLRISRSTRAYIRSHHRTAISGFLVPNVSWSTKIDLPEFLNSDMIRLTERSHEPIVGKNTEKDLIVKAWNNTENETILNVTRNIANNFTNCYGRGDYRYTTFVIIVLKDDYIFDSKVKRKARPYYEYEISDTYYCIVVCKW